jgi:hypothetical protein
VLPDNGVCLVELDNANICVNKFVDDTMYGYFKQYIYNIYGFDQHNLLTVFNVLLPLVTLV